MRTGDLARHALEAMRQDVRQATLSLAGLICGVAVVIAATAIAQGARRAAIEDVESMGVDNVIVRSDDRLVTTGDARAIERAIAEATVAAPLRSARLLAEFPRRAADAAVLGVTPAWQDAIGADLAAGRWLTWADDRVHARVAVLGATAAARFFADNAVGQAFRLGGDWYRVVGVLARPTVRNSPGGLAGFDVPDAILVPLADVDARLGPGDAVDRVDHIIVRARAPAMVVPLAGSLRALFKRRFPSADAVRFIVPRELVAARLRARRAFDVVLVSIGALVIVLSGVGIMNVTLVGIARRVTEIGIRRAVGARQSDIVRQFAAESAALCISGGLIGVPIGVAVTDVLGRMAGWQTAVTPLGAALAFSLSVAVGLASGIYPAHVASRWTPCDALRGE